MKKTLSFLLSCCLILTLFYFPVKVNAVDVSAQGYTTTDLTLTNQYMMNGNLKSESNLLYQAFPKRIFTRNSSYGSEKHFLKYGTNSGTNGMNTYTFNGNNATVANYVSNFIELTNGEIDLITDNDLALDSSVWSRSATNNYMVIEYDLGGNVEVDKFYVCWKNAANAGDARICNGYQLYVSSSQADLYSAENMVYSVSNNKNGINVITFPEDTVGRYFAIKITKCDDGTPTSAVYPRCKEMALTGTRLEETYASWTGIPTAISAGSDTQSYWMNNLPATDPSNVIKGITPATTTFTDSSGCKTVTSDKFATFTDGFFNDTYVNGHYTASNYMSDSSYMDIVWDLGEEKSFWEAWLAFRVETDNNPFYAVKYSLYTSNDKSTLLNSEPLITVDGNAQNVNKISFNKQTARYFAIRVIVPNSSTQFGENNIRVSIMELSLVGVAKRSINVKAVNSDGEEIDTIIEGADSKEFEGNFIELKAPAIVTTNKNSYAFDKFIVDGKEVASVLENNFYKISVEVQKNRQVTAIYKQTFSITNNALIVKGGTSVSIKNTSDVVYKKQGETYEIVSDITKTIDNVEYKLSSWSINGEVVSATNNGRTSIIINGETTIEAIYTKGGNGEYLAIFTDNGNHQIGIYSIPKDTAVSAIVTDSILKQLNSGKLFGYNFTGEWSNNLNDAYNTTVHFKPIYEQNSTTYDVKVGTNVKKAKFDEKITISSSNQHFSSWTHGDSIISTDKESSLYTPGNITITENTFGNGTEVTDFVTVVSANTWDFSKTTYSSAVTANISGISEENFIGCGVLFTSAADFELAGKNWNKSFVLGQDNIIYKELYNYPKNGCFMINLEKIGNNKKRYARAFVKHTINNQTVITYSKSIVKITSEGIDMPEQKETDIITEYSNHPLLPLYGNNPIPYFNESYSKKIVNGSDNGKGSLTDNNPTITPYLVEGAKKCVVIFPGGGYFQRSDNGEGIKVAQEYNKKGYSAFVVRYRIGDSSLPNQGYNVEAILSDGQRAVQFVRYNAKEFGIDPSKIAVCGFSAGGHLSMMVSQNEHIENVVGDRIGEISNIPNATILSYAVTTLGTGTFATMPKILSGNDSAKLSEIVNKYSGEKHVTSSTPASFIWYGESDTAVSPQYNSIAYYNALQTAGVYCEKYSYAGIGHGVGLNAGTGETAWHARSVNFLNKVFE